MKWSILYYVLFTITINNFEVVSLPLGSENGDRLPEPSDALNCTEMKFYCASCTNLLMCVDSDYGYIKQHITCPVGSTCLRDKCTTQRNPLCDGTADIPFQCHVTGIFPDPFDCQKYHFCVPQSDKIVNGILNLTHYEQKCQNKGDKKYKYDPRMIFCRAELEHACEKFPVPLCSHEGETGVVQENNSIFYVCDWVDEHLYPHMYICPHGYVYNKDDLKCQYRSPKPYII